MMRRTAGKRRKCPLCGKHVAGLLTPGEWAGEDLWKELGHKYQKRDTSIGACSSCIQEALLMSRVTEGEAALHENIQMVWPLDAEAAFGALPTPLRMHADPRYRGKGVTIAFLDSGFYPHSDLIKPVNRVRAWVDVSSKQTGVKYFSERQAPKWPGWNDLQAYQWHGMMTSCVAAGNGWMSQGLYRGLASESTMVLVQVRGSHGKIDNESILRGLQWIRDHGPELSVKVVNISVGGDQVPSAAGLEIDRTVAQLVNLDITVVAAAGNAGVRNLIPPATAPFALTIGGIDDKNEFDHKEIELWHSNYGATVEGRTKPELVAPSIWVVAPMLPGTPTAKDAAHLFRRRAKGEDVTRAMLDAKLVTPHYKHVDGTSFSAPLIASVIACMLEADRSLTPDRIKDLLVKAAWSLAGASRERQGAGVLDGGKAIALAGWDRKKILADSQLPPVIDSTGITYLLHDSQARSVEVIGSWNDWERPGIPATQTEPAIWHARQSLLPPGRYWYKFVLNGTSWIDDPANPRKSIDRVGRMNSVLIVP